MGDIALVLRIGWAIAEDSLKQELKLREREKKVWEDFTKALSPNVEKPGDGNPSTPK